MVKNIQITKRLTNCSRGIRYAWHFHYAFILVIRVVCGSIGIALLIPSRGVSCITPKKFNVWIIQHGENI
ncbi:DUF3265 domain-containing protein [Vibrio parahaemolyticus]|nr:DUF3265 domain-containing protein [Vibrio parahaemolyticus]EGQ9495064.1 DUF3265 domain-containing protein [Vibrio parahaemolyticus]EGQ9506497.1 DUF3265 domain-containing protein [Vibrio parahaemolyticus]EGQ9811999.1 DUF3265 domain-containing protein [Vibrio parahaemolyticus]EGR0044318.1 DUF3265 domain-containing protein [Vibrio parahaemolyticus]